MTSPSSVNASPQRTAVRHDNHIDYLDHGRLLHEGDGRSEEHRIANSATNPHRCDPDHRVEAEPGHVHGPNCGHETVPHGDHSDYLVNGRLHHQHGDHIDDHGPLALA